ncbi:MAG: RagB/SusD family nutrient uptake outer membrane protein [Prolixibacteraceae bacterium]|jgi:hypothetical protein
MKADLKYLLIAIAFLIGSCDDQLEIAPKNILTNDQVFANESAIRSYLASLYISLPVESFNFSAKNGFNTWSSGWVPAHTSGEGLSCDNLDQIGNGTWYNWWTNGYKTIRNVNNFIENIADSELNDEKKQIYLGEAYFIRAFNYFGLAKRYGGVPIIRSAQAFTGDNLDELQVERNTEKEVYDFIATQLDSAILLLPSENESGRANKYTALTLKSRAMLYAATEAKYGNVLLDGLVGIPSSAAGAYFQASFDAAEAVMESQKYSLYNATPGDKVANFTNLFIETTDNPELIMVQEYHYPEFVHSYDCWYLPYGVRGPWGYSSRMNPTLEMVEQFEYVDGSPGTLKLTDGTGAPVKYASPADLFKNKDPRCMATVIIPFGTFRGTVIDVQAGIIDDQTSANTGTVYGRKVVSVGDYTQKYDAGSHTVSPTGNMNIISINGIGGSERTMTGFYIRKYLDYNLDMSEAAGWKSTQSWIEMRYAEVLLNYAEAAFELGKIPEAKTAINQIRERAGIALLTDAQVTRDRIRNERMVELAFENQKYWDIRRWHMADQLIVNKRFTALLPYYDLQANAYVFAKTLVGNQLTFWPQLYYEKINPSEIQKNPKLIQNPLY